MNAPDTTGMPHSKCAYCGENIPYAHFHWCLAMSDHFGRDVGATVEEQSAPAKAIQLRIAEALERIAEVLERNRQSAILERGER